jgi:hypothetical protein
MGHFARRPSQVEAARRLLFLVQRDSAVPEPALLLAGVPQTPLLPGDPGSIQDSHREGYPFIPHYPDKSSASFVLRLNGTTLLHYMHTVLCTGIH